MTDCIFCKIARKEVAKEFTYEDDEMMVFPDIHPLTPIHLLIIPKIHIPDFMGVEHELFGKLTSVLKNMVKQHSLDSKGYRIVVNGGGAQFIHHFHMHLMGPMGKAAKM